METAINIFAVIGALASIASVAFAIVRFLEHRRWRRTPTWEDAFDVARRLRKKLEGNAWKPDLVIGIGRSGGIWGGWLAGNLGSLPFLAIDVHYEDTPNGRVVTFPAGSHGLRAAREVLSEAGNVLLVEGAATEGRTFEEFKSQYKRQIADWNVKTAVLYKNPPPANTIDFTGRDDLEPWPKKFPWHEDDRYRRFLRFRPNR